MGPQNQTVTHSTHRMNRHLYPDYITIVQVIFKGRNTIPILSQHTTIDENFKQMKLKPLQKQDQTITEAPQIMTLPGKPARPLKKRRIVSIEPKEEAVDDTRSQSSQNDNRRKVGRKKEKRARTTISPLPSPRTSPATVIKKSVSWNDPGGNVVHVQPDPSQLYPYFNESDLWYTVSLS